MPNYCDNTLHIYCRTEKEVDYILSQIETDGKLDFEKIFKPSEQELKTVQTLTNYFSDIPGLPDVGAMLVFDWYAWRIANWGTKWNVCSQYNREVDKTYKEIIYGFDTAWSPPTGVYEKLAEKFPFLEFTTTFVEPGAGFEGEGSAGDGEYVESSWDYQQENEENE